MLQRWKGSFRNHGSHFVASLQIAGHFLLELWVVAPLEVISILEKDGIRGRWGRPDAEVSPWIRSLLSLDGEQEDGSRAEVEAEEGGGRIGGGWLERSLEVVFFPDMQLADDF